VNDGFDIKFVVLTGPDYISRQASLPWNAWNCEEIIVSDISRWADFATSSDTLWRLRNCEPWKKISWNGDEATQHATRIAGYLSGAISPKFLAALSEEGQQNLNFLEASVPLTAFLEPTYFESMIEHLRHRYMTQTEAVRVCHVKVCPNTASALFLLKEVWLRPAQRTFGT